MIKKALIFYFDMGGKISNAEKSICKERARFASELSDKITGLVDRLKNTPPDNCQALRNQIATYSQIYRNTTRRHYIHPQFQDY